MAWARRTMVGWGRWTGYIISSSIIFGLLVFIVVNFYVFSSIVNLDSFIYAFLLLSLLTDGLFAFIHFPRRRQHSVGKKQTHFDPAKLTIVIACHNGADVIKETIDGAVKHVPPKQVIVVSDASTDDTAKIARESGVYVIENKVNLHKVGSINAALDAVNTPYVLILDDDTLIGDTLIPTSLLDEGYTAVAFNVMPVRERTLINELQRFEYRNSMQVGKHMRAKAGAIGNVSGAIGLYRTHDLRQQIKKHSGQFAGEDEQRTLLAHMYGEGKGITYTDSLVLTKPPATYRELFRQRAFSWSLSVPELFILYWRVLLSPRYHFLLKAEKSYLLYIYLTDPLRMLFAWALILRPVHIITTYVFYLLLNTAIWLRIGRQDTLRAIIFSPLYTLSMTVCRFIGYFYWLVEKARYLGKRRYRPVTERRLLLEYSLTFLVIAVSWVISAQHFVNDMQLLSDIRSGSLSNNSESGAFNYTSISVAPSIALSNAAVSSDVVSVLMEQGDTPRAVADKAINEVLIQSPSITLGDAQRWKADMWLVGQLPSLAHYEPGKAIDLSRGTVQRAIDISLRG
ncbi:MAG TPA: glycosyltransferase [Candidatus Saccharimonadales bacterium]